MREPIRCRERKLKPLGIGNAGAVEIGRCLTGFLGKLADLLAGAMYQDDANAQAAQESDIQEEVAEIIAFDNAAVDRDDKYPVAILRHITKHFPQVGETEHP